MRLVQLSHHSIAFPSPEGALREPNGLLALGGDLSPARLLMAYQRGIFPWFSPGDPILWWSPIRERYCGRRNSISAAA